MPKSRTVFEALTSSMSNEWYTPPWVFDLVRKLGPIGLDPASNSTAQRWINAAQWYGEAEDGMKRSWKTTEGLWLNPPYGLKNLKRGIYGANRWILKAIDSYHMGCFPWAVLLVRGDSEAVHWLELSAMSCEPYKRIAFICLEAKEKQNPVPGCRFWYLGQEPKRFAEVFSEVGAIRIPYRGNEQ